MREGLQWFPVLALCGVYALHFSFILRHAVDVPYRGEWPLLGPRALPAGLTRSWLFSFQNVHRLVPTRLQVWLLYQWNGWDLVVHQAINFLIFGALVLLVVRGLRRAAPTAHPGYAYGFAIFLLSPMCYINHFWGIQSLIHFVLLFSLLAVSRLFGAQRPGSLAAGVVFAWCAVYSMAGGVVTTVVLAFVYAVFKVLRAAGAGSGTVRRRELATLAWVLAALGAGTAPWFIGYSQAAARATVPPAALFSAHFWRFFLHLISSGFGFVHFSILAALFGLALMAIPLAGELIESRGRPSPEFFRIAAVLVGLVAVCGTIALGRGGKAQVTIPPRYLELAMLLVPFTAAAWGVWLERHRRLSMPVLAALWLALCVSYADRWDFSAYRRHGQLRAAGLACLAEYFYDGRLGQGCWEVYPFRATYLLDTARDLGLSFTLDLEARGDEDSVDLILGRQSSGVASPPGRVYPLSRSKRSSARSSSAARFLGDPGLSTYDDVGWQQVSVSAE